MALIIQTQYIMGDTVMPFYSQSKSSVHNKLHELQSHFPPIAQRTSSIITSSCWKSTVNDVTPSCIHLEENGNVVHEDCCAQMTYLGYNAVYVYLSYIDSTTVAKLYQTWYMSYMTRKWTLRIFKVWGQSCKMNGQIGKNLWTLQIVSSSNTICSIWDAKPNRISRSEVRGEFR